MSIYLASLRALIRDTSSRLRAWHRRSRWVDDGPCTCPEAVLRHSDTCPEKTPSEKPLSPLLETYEQELRP